MGHKHTQTGVHTLCTDKKEVIKGRRFIRLIFYKQADKSAAEELLLSELWTNTQKGANK